MPAPSASSNSAVNLNLGNVPQIEDPAIYEAFLNIHTAIEALLTATTDINTGLLSVTTNIHTVTTDYTLLPTDGTVILDAFSALLTVTLPTVVGIKGTKYVLKCIDATFRAFVATDGTELIDSSSIDFELYTGESIVIQSDGTKWIVI